MAFTKEELAAMEQADAEIEKDFVMTDQERREARERHRADLEKRRARDRENYRKNRETVLTRNKRWRDRVKAERSAIGGNEHD